MYEINIKLRLYRIKGIDIIKNRQIKKTLKKKLIPPILDVLGKTFDKHKIDYESVVEIN